MYKTIRNQCMDNHVGNSENSNYYFAKYFKIAMQLHQLYYHVRSAIKYIRTTELVMQNERKHRSRYNFLFIFKGVLGDTVIEVKHFLPGSHHTRVIWTSALNDLFRSVMFGRNGLHEKLELVHSSHFSGVIFREIGHLATIPIFWSNRCKKSTNYKARIDPEIYKIKLYCIVIILYRMHTPKKPLQSRCNPLDAIIVTHVYKTPRPLPKF